jgi:penicillin amidase
MRRIRALLDSAEGLTAEDLGRMQYDTYSGRAADLCPALLALLGRGSEGASRRVGEERSISTTSTPQHPNTPTPEDPALEALRAWDYRFDVESVGASVFQVFWLAWTRRVAAARFPAHLVGSAAGGCAHVAHRILTAGDGAAGEPWFEAGRARAEIVAAFREGVAWLAERLGTDPAGWTWGTLHPVTFRHALADRFPACTELNVGPFPCPGTSGVLNQNGFSVGDRLAVTSGPHYRFLADLASPNAALGTHTSGNSGHPGSPHYHDQAADWLAGRTHPLYMDRTDIHANAAGTFILAPD